MKGKSKAALFLGVALIAGAAAPGRPAWAARQEINMAEAERPGVWIREMTTDRSMYSPGETIRARVEFMAGRTAADGRLLLILRHLDQAVWEQEMAVSPAEIGRAHV